MKSIATIFTIAAFFGFSAFALDPFEQPHVPSSRVKAPKWDAFRADLEERRGLVAASPTRLRVEYVEAPLTVDTPLPRFSWAVEGGARGEVQKTYRLVVSTQEGKVWDSGDISSNQTLNVEYDGSTELVSDMDYMWTVSITTSVSSTPVSASSTFSTALLRPIPSGDFRGAGWVGSGGMGNVFYATVPLDGQVVRGRAYFAGLGYGKLVVNGEVVGDRELGYFTRFEQRVRYDVLDITTNLQTAGSCSAIRVELGNGWFAQSSVNSGPQQFLLLLSITYSNGTTTYYSSQGNTSYPNPVSPSSNPTSHPIPLSTTASSSTPLTFHVTQGPVTFDDIYNGEIYDARLEQSGWDSCSFPNVSNWHPTTPSPNPARGVLRSVTLPVVRDEEYTALSVTEPSPGVYVVDFGQNMAGMATLQFSGLSAGTNITIRYAETLFPDGNINNYYNWRMQANFISAGLEQETYTTKFSFFGFQYISVSGLPYPLDAGDATAHFLHTDMPPAGGLAISNNASTIVHLWRASQLGNAMDVISDCPQRERRQWLGDLGISAENYAFNYDMAAFFVKILDDIKDEQLYQSVFSGQNGAIPDVAPFYHHGGVVGDPAWSQAYPLIADFASALYADPRMAKEHYDAVVWFLNFEEQQVANESSGGVLEYARYGDWCSVEQGLGDGCDHKYPDLSTFYYIIGLQAGKNLAERVGDAGNATRFASLIDATTKAYHQVFFHPGNGSYGVGLQINQVLALTLYGMGFDNIFQSQGEVSSTVAALLNNLNGSHAMFPNLPSGGIIYARWLQDALSVVGLDAYGYDVVTAWNQPSYGYFATQGATTMWEGLGMTRYTGTASRNHHMFSGPQTPTQYIIAGLNRDRMAPSYTRPILYPHPPTDGSAVAAAVDSTMGMVAVNGTAGPPGICGMVPEHGIMNLTCEGGGVFTSVKFASFGTPNGECGSFVVDPSCNSNRSMAVVEHACLGRSSCQIDAENDVFGGDPCLDVFKRLYVQLAGNCSLPGASIGATVPSGAIAQVVVSLGSSQASKVMVKESQGIVWKNGNFVSGVPGITGATHNSQQNTISFTTLSGEYNFEVFG